MEGSWIFEDMREGSTCFTLYECPHYLRLVYVSMHVYSAEQSYTRLKTQPLHARLWKHSIRPSQRGRATAWALLLMHWALEPKGDMASQCNSLSWWRLGKGAYLQLGASLQACLASSSPHSLPELLIWPLATTPFSSKAKLPCITAGRTRATAPLTFNPWYPKVDSHLPKTFKA